MAWISRAIASPSVPPKIWIWGHWWKPYDALHLLYALRAFHHRGGGDYANGPDRPWQIPDHLYLGQTLNFQALKAISLICALWSADLQALCLHRAALGIDQDENH